MQAIFATGGLGIEKTDGRATGMEGVDPVELKLFWDWKSHRFTKRRTVSISVATILFRTQNSTVDRLARRWSDGHA